MKRFKSRKKLDITKILMLVITLVFFFTSCLYFIYFKKANSRIIDVAEIKLNQFMNYFLSNNIGYDILNSQELENILIINKNSDGEILYVDYNLDQAYKVLDNVTNVLESQLTSLREGETNINDKDIFINKNILVLKIPFLISSKNILLSNLGPKIYVPVNFNGAILTNLKSKITNYGMNNALVELYITINITTNIISPLSEKSNVIDYEVLIASNVINGRVPTVYGGLIQSESSTISIPIEN